MTVIQYCREKTTVSELVIIREGGWRIEPINNCPYCGRRVVIPKRSLLEVIQGGSKAPRD